ncbi:hypothetical protein GCM10007100_24350 [Roseibacillus persicicus]|uniref:Uncharacterized protein n=2 Tax=Roseibacillus persicicus TaxID=454148 RepID=A0A918WL28_9BACT|nr:hypothetical protein GCM10007100_24350 [Roseibacillus persicicus]
MALPFFLTSCAAIAESAVEGLFGYDRDKDDHYYSDSREKRERRAQYRTQGKPSLSLD